jgi:hypothetical protein
MSFCHDQVSDFQKVDITQAIAFIAQEPKNKGSAKLSVDPYSDISTLI